MNVLKRYRFRLTLQMYKAEESFPVIRIWSDKVKYIYGSIPIHALLVALINHNIGIVWRPYFLGEEILNLQVGYLLINFAFLLPSK